MSTAELKLDLISQIAGLTDKVKLRELMELLKFQTEESLYITSKEEKSLIAEARQEVAEGKVFTNEEVQKEIKEWLQQ
ncbi:hypothetical protein [Kaistella antarctica]|uniref:Uncharacterized protein n=1 Tax=Kaistella antarctica TaxID=266748 RepID=A0A3S4YGY2_9FLAO|nr:hypothetical protein [Kaistella antarctica]KEY19772.1 hypothetical protein HY04_00640 [Kaistella antarctica]SEV97928.1 hypothetical protein SAMN05421765_1648 [Kaistella antarctica]VEH96523.1 Uncharacterised protein [Kaistella antarctica]